MKILIIPNLGKQDAAACTAETAVLLKKLDYSVLIEREYSDIFSALPARFGELDDLLCECDRVISIGGDGSIIHSAILAAKHRKLILGINTGRLGFLAQLESTNLDRLSDILSGNFIEERRMLLQADIYVGGERRERRYALNDVVISRSEIGKMIDLEIYCNDRPFGSYRADGIIIATPTGSTAYTLSAGGAIIDPEINSLILTPICPHSIFDRSVVFSPDRKLTVKSVQLNSSAQMAVGIDGVNAGNYGPSDMVVIGKADLQVRFMRLPDMDFYDILNKKMLTNR